MTETLQIECVHASSAHETRALHLWHLTCSPIPPPVRLVGLPWRVLLMAVICSRSPPSRPGLHHPILEQRQAGLQCRVSSACFFLPSTERYSFPPLYIHAGAPVGASAAGLDLSTVVKGWSHLLPEAARRRGQERERERESECDRFLPHTPTDGIFCGRSSTVPHFAKLDRDRSHSAVSFKLAMGFSGRFESNYVFFCAAVGFSPGISSQLDRKVRRGLRHL